MPCRYGTGLSRAQTRSAQPEEWLNGTARAKRGPIDGRWKLA